MNTPRDDAEQDRILAEHRNDKGCFTWLVVGCIWAGIFASWLLL